MSNKQLENRMNRLQGQLRKLQENISDNDDCADVIPQFLAVKGAVAGAFEEYVKLSLDSCVKSDEKKVAKLIRLLVRN